ncbi:MAG: type II secretion system protein N, partial [Planctomycetota bacterium]
TVLNEAGGVEPKFPDEPVQIVDRTEDEPAPVTEQQRSTSNFRFLGGFFSPSRSLAIIAGAGKQRMVREGDEIDFGFTVGTISEDFVEIERNGVVERLDRQVATGAVVATATPSPAMESPDDRIDPGTNVSESARDRLRKAREQAAQRAGTDRAKQRADYNRQRQERLEELREQGIDVDELEWQRDN